MNTLPVLTKRLQLRRFQPDDLDAFFAYRSDPEVGRYQGWNPCSAEEVRQFIAEQEKISLDLPGRWFQIAIARRNTNAIIGDIGLCLITRDEAEIGFSLAREAQGFGYATEAVAAILRTLPASAGVRTLRAVTDARNSKSMALLERLGFVLKRTSDEIFHGQWCRQHRFSISLPARPERA